LSKFLHALYTQYKELFFTYLEVNPLVVVGSEVYILDLAAKVKGMYRPPSPSVSVDTAGPSTHT
jgi:succinyl-CoA synthetase beta subunit